MCLLTFDALFIWLPFSQKPPFFGTFGLAQHLSFFSNPPSSLFAQSFYFFVPQCPHHLFFHIMLMLFRNFLVLLFPFTIFSSSTAPLMFFPHICLFIPLIDWYICLLAHSLSLSYFFSLSVLVKKGYQRLLILLLCLF